MLRAAALQLQSTVCAPLPASLLLRFAVCAVLIVICRLVAVLYSTACALLPALCCLRSAACALLPALCSLRFVLVLHRLVFSCLRAATTCALPASRRRLRCVRALICCLRLRSDELRSGRLRSGRLLSGRLRSGRLRWLLAVWPPALFRLCCATDALARFAALLSRLHCLCCWCSAVCSLRARARSSCALAHVLL